MQKTLVTLVTTLLFVVLLDVTVAGLLAYAERRGELSSLVRYFEYGRSVPGKHARWQAEPGTPGNLFEVSWADDMLAASRVAFLAEDPATLVVRGYGMSFLDNILKAAARERSGLAIDLHSGPGAPPNFAYARFLDDRENRRAGDVVVLGVLSSSVPAMTALTNATWVFEQPAPLTYPIFRLDPKHQLRRIDPLVKSAAEQRALATDPAKAEAWRAQLAAEDAFYSPMSFGLTYLDQSPFARLVRRKTAVSIIEKRKTALAGGDANSWTELSATLQQMMLSFAQIAQEDGQTPVVILIQTRGPEVPDLRAAFAPILEANGISYLATDEIADPTDPGVFLGDGHFTPERDAALGAAFLRILQPKGDETRVQPSGSR